jgi:hypothetical protein
VGLGATVALGVGLAVCEGSALGDPLPLQAASRETQRASTAGTARAEFFTDDEPR